MRRSIELGLKLSWGPESGLRSVSRRTQRPAECSRATLNSGAATIMGHPVRVGNSSGSTVDFPDICNCRDSWAQRLRHVDPDDIPRYLPLFVYPKCQQIVRFLNHTAICRWNCISDPLHQRQTPMKYCLISVIDKLFSPSVTPFLDRDLQRD